MDFVEAGYASAMTGCLTGRGASGARSCFFTCALCVLRSSALVYFFGGTFPDKESLAGGDDGTAIFWLTVRVVEVTAIGLFLNTENQELVSSRFVDDDN